MRQREASDEFSDSTRNGQMALDRFWDTAVRGAHARGIGTRESRASAAARRVEGARAAAAARGGGPALLGFAIEAVVEVPAFAAGGAAGNGGRLAPAGISTVLGVK